MSSVSAYALAILAVVTAVLIRWLLDPLLGDTLPLVTLFGAVAAAVWAGGYGPGLLSAITGYAACAYLFIQPRGLLGLDELGNLVGLIAYLFTCSLIIAFGQAMRWAHVSANERRELLRVTLSSIGDAVITSDVDGRVTYLNPIAESLTGWTRSEAHGQPLDTVFRIVSEETRQPVENPALRALREGIVVGLANHTMLIRKDGSESPIDDSAAPIRDEHGEVSGCVLIFRDVTTQRRIDRDRVAQLHTTRLLASIVETSDDAIISKSLDGVIRTWNAAAERLFGYRAEEAIGRHISLVIPKERMAEEDHIIASLKAGRRIDHFETERQGRDGKRMQVSLTVSPLRDDTGAVIGASKIVRDISDRKRMEDDLRQLAAHLSEADRRKDEFLATLAHELRNPLAPLGNMLEVLKRAEGDRETVQRARETMDRQLAQLVRLVDDLLDLNRITHNRLELRQSQVALAPVIQQSVEASRPHADAAGHELIVSLPEKALYTYADPVRLAQVFDNLLNNSCKYTDPGGKIWVTAREEGAELVVSVRDTGSGIPADKIDTIFEMFTQVDRSPERSQGGLGIGLTIVRRLVEMHGGSIEAKSAGVGQGSEFVLRLPLLAEAAPEPPAPEAQQLPDGRRILIVDDNSDAAISLALLLDISGNATHTAHDGLEALEAFERYRPDVILLDIGLPKLSGHEVCRRIRERPGGQDVVIIALTGWGQDADRRRSQDAGFDGHLVKPVDYIALMELLGSVGSNVDRPGSRGQEQQGPVALTRPE